VKFYVISATDGETLGCEFSIAEAKRFAERTLHPHEGYTVERIIIEGSPREALRRILGAIGGYADESHEVYSRPDTDPPPPAD
jgi:hypothetical protein